jgi:hypothetical protein
MMIIEIEYIKSREDLLGVCRKYGITPILIQPTMTLSRVCEILYRDNPDKKYAVMTDTIHAVVVSYDDISDIENAVYDFKALVNPDGSGRMMMNKWSY